MVTILIKIAKTRQDVEREMIKCRKIIKSDGTDQEANEMLSSVENQYDWTVIIHMKTKTPIEKKKIIQKYIVAIFLFRSMD